MEIVLGIDTSCYTSSVAVMDCCQNLLAEQRTILQVKQGERGLAQSEGVFQHTRNLPVLIERIKPMVSGCKITGVAASSRPRNQEGSYMPVFKVAEGYGRSIAALLGVPFIAVSHQEGHLAAGLWSAKGPQQPTFLAVHLSGGTSEVLLVNTCRETMEIKILGATLDLHAGQLIDRIGVAMGLPFPAGRELEFLARKGQSGKVRIPSAVKGYNMSFSGAEACAMRMLTGGCSPADIALALLQCVANTLEKILRRAVEDANVKEILLVGGVAANQILKQRLQKRLEHPAVGAKLFFAEPRYSTDNAVGVALLGCKKIYHHDNQHLLQL